MFVFIFAGWEVKFFNWRPFIDKSYPFQAVIVSLLKLSPFTHTASDETEMKSDQWEKSNLDGVG